MSSSRIKPYLGVGTGLLLINQGKVEITNWMGSVIPTNQQIYLQTQIRITV